MLFCNAPCETCRSSIATIDGVAFAYTVKRKFPHKVDLCGCHPWSGVRVVCVLCSIFFAENSPLVSTPQSIEEHQS